MGNEKKAIKRLTDFDFSQENCHVALVDQAANEHSIVVMKAKQVNQTPVEKNADQVSDEPKDDNMSDSENKEVEVEVVEKAAEVTTEAAETSTEEVTENVTETTEVVIEKGADKVDKVETDNTDVSVEEILKANKDLEKQLATLKAANEAAEKSEFVAKAKENTNIVKDAEADALYAIKCLAPEAYEVVIKAIQVANNALENMEVVTKSVGSSEEGNVDENLTFEDQVKIKSLELMEASPSMKGYVAREKAREILRAAK